MDHNVTVQRRQNTARRLAVLTPVCDWQPAQRKSIDSATPPVLRFDTRRGLGHVGSSLGSGTRWPVVLANQLIIDAGSNPITIRVRVR